MNLDLLGLQIESPLAHPGANNFRPPCWPPTPDWAPIVDANGHALCIYSDSSWPLDEWAGKPLKINFGDGKTKGSRISPANADLLRQCAVWFLWGPRGCRNAGTFADRITRLKPLFVVCTEQGIVATDLARFERVIDRIAAALSPSGFNITVALLHDLLAARENLGFCLLDKDGLVRLARHSPSHDVKQTPYIPPRIWSYQIFRLKECLQDYIEHRSQIEKCFDFCIGVYSHHFGSFEHAINVKPGRATTSIFRKVKSPGSYESPGTFMDVCDRFGVTDLIERWIAPFTNQKGEKQIVRFSQYLDLVSTAGLAYLLNFSLMRIDEGTNLRSDCLQVEKDATVGDIYMLCGVTTKTDPDSEARWPVSKSVSIAIDAMKHIATLRTSCAIERKGGGATIEDCFNPYLMTYQHEPWSRGKQKQYRLRPKCKDYQQWLDSSPRLFDRNQVTINEEDFRIALLMTPRLDKKLFQIGMPWRFGWHQLRRTGAVNMLSSDLVDESSLQLQLKHLSRAMTLYYGRNHFRLALSEETRALFVKTIYQEIGRDLRRLPDPQFVSPLGSSRKQDIITFIHDADAAALDKAAKQGKVGARRIRAGFCVNPRPCPYGGIESISHCLGGSQSKGCPDLLVDTSKGADIQLYEKTIDDQLEAVHPDSPRHLSLLAEKRAIQKYYEVIESHNRRR